jgi:chromosome segregation protein
VDVVECPDDLRPLAARLLFKVAVVDDLAPPGAGRELPDVTAVTRDGDLLGAHFAPAARPASRA